MNMVRFAGAGFVLFCGIFLFIVIAVFRSDETVAPHGARRGSRKEA